MNPSRLTLVVDDLIEISFPFDTSLIEVVREIPERKWNGTKKVWTVPATEWHSHQVIQVLKPLDFWLDPTIEKLADDKAPAPKIKFPKGLYKYQEEGIKFMLKTKGRCIVADVMGLGKTIEALTFVKLFAGKTLVVSPSSVSFKWAKECARWLSDRSVQVITTGKTPLKPVDVHIMSYALMVSKYEELAQTDYNCVIFDESHYIKSAKAQRTRIAKSLVKGGIPHVLFLSGTPFMNRPAELFTQLNMLAPHSFNNEFMFRVRYCDGQKMVGSDGKAHFFFPRNGTSNLDELSQRLGDVMLRRTKKDVALDIPDLTRSYLPVDLTNSKEYHSARRDLITWMKVNGIGSGTLNPKQRENVLVKLNVLRQIVGQGKVEAALELINDILDSEEQVVVFAHHKAVVQELVEALDEYGVGVISGDVPNKDRQPLIDRFLKQTLISKNKIRVMIITVAGSEGIDLYSASNIVFVEREWTPAKEEQAEARLHRIGQKNPVTAHYLVAQGTIDEKMNDLIASKREVFGTVIHQDEIFSTILESLSE